MVQARRWPGGGATWVAGWRAGTTRKVDWSSDVGVLLFYRKVAYRDVVGVDLGLKGAVGCNSSGFDGNLVLDGGHDDPRTPRAHPQIYADQWVKRIWCLQS